MMSQNPLNRIMYVEDDPSIQRLVQLTLERVGGFQVQVCDSGEQALRDVSEFKPDLILLDVMMPGMDGPQTLAALREAPTTERIPVVFMTAKAGADEVRQLMAMGVQGVIIKPFNPMTLAAEIQTIWDAI
ncbi:response regulator [Salinispirillum marinum]|uniref:Response regulator n=2 Tax=Saccharospirillaceae TaxID=255527 RepID=A0ABV8BAR8_9GAMM